MMDMDKLKEAEAIVGQINSQMPKRLKDDRGLIERTEKSRMILTEDNKQLLMD